MAKMTISELQNFAKNYVDVSKQAGTWVASNNSTIGFLDKIGKQITIDGEFNDPLTIMNGDDLPLGKTIEEYFVDFTLAEDALDPTDASYNPADAFKPHFPTVEDCSYSYELKKKKVSTSMQYDDFERGCINGEALANVSGTIMSRLEDSYSLTTYAQKKQILANVITKASTIDGLTETLAVPTDATTGEDFIKSIKLKIRDAKFAHMGDCLNGKDTLIKATPKSELVLLTKKNVFPSLEVDTLAGAFNKEMLETGVKVIEVDDFGSDTTGVYAMLVDIRGLKLHNNYKSVRTDAIGGADMVNIHKFFNNTAFISKFTFVHIYKAA